ncbi:MAG: ATP-binding cassette domain-containing protein [Myxococcota bacterium]
MPSEPPPAPPLFELQRVGIEGPLGHVLGPLDLALPHRQVTAVVGPVGSGKSTLLRLLSGRAPSEGWQASGCWRFRGRPMSPLARGGAPLGQVAWVPQIPHAPAGPFSDPKRVAMVRARIDGAFFCGAEVVLLDEPTRGMPPEDREDLLRRFHDHVDRGTVVFVSHDLEFTQRASDHVCLLCDGELITHCSASEFFEQPQRALVRQFLRYGTCAQQPALPSCPSHFHWFREGHLAGMGMPGLFRDLDDDLFSIAHAGVTLLVSLTEDPLPSSRLRPFGIAGRHFPIRDMGIPSLADAIALCHDLVRAMDRGQVVAVHCRAGLGRTGTIVAGVGVCLGMSADEAIARVRANAPGSIQTPQQAALVHQLEAHR